MLVHPGTRMSDDAGLLKKRRRQNKFAFRRRETPSFFAQPETPRDNYEATCRQPTVFTVTSDVFSAATQYLRLNVMALGLNTQAFVKSPGHRLAF